MQDRIFQDAYARVRSQYNDQDWFALSPREVTDSIYREMRAIDAERLVQVQHEAASVGVAAE